MYVVLKILLYVLPAEVSRSERVVIYQPTRPEVERRGHQ